MAEHPVAIIGALGRMGVEVRAAVTAHPELAVAGALEAPGHAGLGSAIERGVEVVTDPKAAFAGCEVAMEDQGDGSYKLFLTRSEASASAAVVDASVVSTGTGDNLAVFIAGDGVVRARRIWVGY